MTRRAQVLLMLLVLGLGVVLWQHQQERKCNERLALRRGVDEINELIHEVEDWNTCVRSAAAFDLQRTGPLGVDAIPGLIRLLEDSSDSVRWRAAAALGHIGIASPSVIRSLITSLQDKHNTVRLNAVFALAELSPPEATRAMASLATDPDPLLRYRAIYSLRFLALPGDREWLCPLLTATIAGTENGWLAAAETSGLVGCLDLIPCVEDARTRWIARCPSDVKNTDVSQPSQNVSSSTESEKTGMECGSNALTLRVLSQTLKRLSIRKALEQRTE